MLNMFSSKENSIEHLKDKDTLTVVTMSGLYILAALLGFNEYGYMFTSMVLVHAGFVYISMESKKSGVAKTLSLLPMIIIGVVCYFFVSGHFSNGLLRKVILDNILDYMLIGVVPLFLQRLIFFITRDK